MVPFPTSTLKKGSFWGGDFLGCRDLWESFLLLPRNRTALPTQEELHQLAGDVIESHQFCSLQDIQQHSETASTKYDHSHTYCSSSSHSLRLFCWARFSPALLPLPFSWPRTAKSEHTEVIFGLLSTALAGAAAPTASLPCPSQLSRVGKVTSCRLTSALNGFFFYLLRGSVCLFAVVTARFVFRKLFV